MNEAARAACARLVERLRTGVDADVVDGLAAAFLVEALLRVTGPPKQTWIQWFLPFTRSDFSSTFSTGIWRTQPMAVSAQGSRALCRRATSLSSVASESGRVVISWIMASDCYQWELSVGRGLMQNAIRRNVPWSAMEIQLDEG